MDQPNQPNQPAIMLHLHLHGPARLVAADGRENALERRAAGLCALVALEPGFARERAATWLWPDSSDPRRNLRQQLLRFRQLYGQAVLDGGERLRLAEGVVLAAAEGPLLPGLDFGDSPELAAWFDTRRQAALLQQARQLHDELAAAEADGDLDAALAAATRHAAADPDSEAAAREQMRLHYLRGEPAAGLAVFERLRVRLATGYGSAPAAATRELADTLRRGEALRPAAQALRAEQATRAAPYRLPLSLQRPPVMAGREDERAAVLRAWAEGRAVLLEGEAGLGKSRLMADLAAAGHTLSAAGRPGDGGAPYATLTRLLAPLWRLPVPALDAPARLALAHLAPGGADPAHRTAPLRPGALPAAVHAMLAAHGVETVMLDDLHFADAATLELVAGLVASAEPPRRWLLAQRPGEAPAAAQSLRDDLAEQRRLDVVTLGPLNAEAAATLVDALAIPGLDGASIAAALVRHTGGNPLYLLETLKQGLQDGSLARGHLPRPDSVGALIERRLQRLSSPALMLARVAAIAGVDFCIELAEATTGHSAVQLAGPWGELQAAQVLRDEAFAHDLVADAALRSVPPVVARRVHAQCAEWLNARGAEPVRVALHWLRGGVPARAGEAFTAAAQRAERAARLHEEAMLYAQAAEAYSAAGMDEASFQARSRRVRALQHDDCGDQALAECRLLADTAATDGQRIQALTEQCGLLTERGEPEAAIAVGQVAMALARPQGDGEWPLRIACHMASALCRLGRADESLALLLPLRAWVEAQPDDALRLLWHGDWAATLGHLGRRREAVAAYDMARAAARRAGLRDAEGRLLLNCAVTLRQGGQFDRAVALAIEGRALSGADLGAGQGAPIDRLVVARDEAETGRYATALPALEALLPVFQASGAGFWLQATRMVLVRLWMDLGQPARALPLLHDAPADLPPWLQADRLLLQVDLGLLLQRSAAADAATAGIQAAWMLAASDAARGPLLRVRALRHAPPSRLRAEAAALAPMLRQTERFGALMSLQVHLAEAALAMGDAEAAADAAASVLALFEEGCAPDSMYRGEAWWVAHRALATAGHSDASALALQQGTRWVTQQALPKVPPAFIDSFLHRNPVNRALLAAASR